MSLIRVPKTFMNPYTMPPELAPYITPEIWKAICDSRQSNVRSAHFSSLFAGLIVGYPLLIICMLPLSLNGHVQSINAKYFKHKSVVSYTWNDLVINTSLIPQESMNTFQVLPPVTSAQAMGYAAVASPVPVATPLAEGKDPAMEKAMSGYAGSATPAQAAPAATASARQMRITVPNVAPGSTITVTSPEGVSFPVTLPFGVQPGQSMVIPY